jgi:hypothetical protein
VADTYNHRIRYVDPMTGRTRTLALDLPLDEPGGVSAAEGVLYVADTNQHRVLAFDPATGGGRSVWPAGGISRGGASCR